MKQHIRYGTKNADGTVTWGDWQECGSEVAEITTEEIQEIFKEVYGR